MAGGRALIARRPVMTGGWRNVRLYTQNRLDARFGGSGVKIDRAEKVAVVGQRNR